INQTEAAGHHVSLQLVATRTVRDAVGAEVTVSTNRSRWTKQLTAGDGFQASNERSLIFGLGDFSQPVEVTVHWPSGETETISDVAVDCTLIIVEGQSDATVWTGIPPVPSRVVRQQPVDN
ncbi:MAG: ASPIC/UnbV domain-containing protein, partial [Planctomycetota bacterium]